MSNNKGNVSVLNSTQWLDPHDIGMLLSADDLVLGVDKVKLVFPIVRPNPSFAGWTSSSRRFSPGRGVTQTQECDAPTDLHAGFRVGFSEHALRGMNGWVEFNPSRMSHPDGRLSDVEGAVSCIQRVLSYAKEYLIFNAHPDRLNLHRLDLTVDFSPVIDMQRVLYLARRASPYLRAKPNVFFSKQTGEAESVTFSTKTAGSLVVYDKSAKEGWETPTLRVEVQASRKELVRHGLSLLSSLSLPPMVSLFRHRTKSLVDLCLYSPETRTTQILTCKQNTNHLIAIAGREYLESCGVVIPRTDHYVKVDRKFKKTYPYVSVKDLL